MRMYLRRQVLELDSRTLQQQQRHHSMRTPSQKTRIRRWLQALPRLWCMRHKEGRSGFSTRTATFCICTCTHVCACMRACSLSRACAREEFLKVTSLCHSRLANLPARHRLLPYQQAGASSSMATGGSTTRINLQGARSWRGRRRPRDR